MKLIHYIFPELLIFLICTSTYAFIGPLPPGNGSGSGGGGAGFITPNRAAVSDTTGALLGSTTTDVEIGYISGATSSIQTQLNTKGNFSGPASSTAFGLVRYADTTGKTSLNSPITLDTAGVMSVPNTSNCVDNNIIKFGNTSICTDPGGASASNLTVLLGTGTASFKVGATGSTTRFLTLTKSAAVFFNFDSSAHNITVNYPNSTAQNFTAADALEFYVNDVAVALMPLRIATDGTLQIGATTTAKQHALNVSVGTNGAQVMTLTNGPAAATAGNPAVWVKMTVNGVTTYIPGWQ